MSKKRKKQPDVSWMNQFDMSAGPKNIALKTRSFPAKLLQKGASIPWDPFRFRIHKVLAKKKRRAIIIEDGTDDKVEVLIGTQFMNLIQSANLKGVLLYCECYAVTFHEGRNYLGVWTVEIDEEREARLKREMDESLEKLRQYQMEKERRQQDSEKKKKPIIRLKRKRKSRRKKKTSVIQLKRRKKIK